ncbi:unnamed protein product [Paramecium octaurelia]|uniref:Uncharacterized protein n=1 Tax=Paramecium octaurelia TaxID=43137 RepID=A0A8S1YM34_PAROT|nr:unnamed protein product [Paramecium octaurelia]
MIQNTSYEDNLQCWQRQFFPHLAQDLRYLILWSLLESQLRGQECVYDVVEVGVDIEKKQIKWIKQKTNQNFSLEFDSTTDLYPYIHIKEKTLTYLKFFQFSLLRLKEKKIFIYNRQIY